MAITRDEEIYNLRKANAENNLKQWQNWSVSINYVVNQFNDVISNLTERLDMAETTIEALMTKINHMDDTYVKLQYSNLQIAASARQYYTKLCGVFSNVSTGLLKQYPINKIYVYANNTVKGLYVNNVPVEENYIADSSHYYPFACFSGSDAGSIVTIKTYDTDKIAGGNVNLYFSLNSSLKELKPSVTDDITQQLTLKINYARVVVKSLETLDKSVLSKTILQNTAMISDKKFIDQFSGDIGLFSTTKTVANIAADAKDTDSIK